VKREALALAVALAVLGGLGAIAVREGLQRQDSLTRRVRKSEDRLRRAAFQQSRQSTGLALRAAGFEPWFEAEPPAVAPGCTRVLFVSHIYPKNGIDENGARYADPDAALASLFRAEAALAPARVFFGGDSIQRPSARGIDFIRSLQQRWPHARFVLGNHEDWWSESAAPLRELIRDRHGREDFGSARVIWLHSVAAAGDYGIDAEELAFLEQSLAGEFRYAVLLLHHALWAGDSAYVNKDYENAAALRKEWMERTLPQLAAGRVKLVLMGDGGWRRPGTLAELRGIPHATTGWSGYLATIPPEWLTAELCADGPTLTRHVAFDGELLRRVEWPPETK